MREQLVGVDHIERGVEVDVWLDGDGFVGGKRDCSDFCFGGEGVATGEGCVYV